MRPPEQRLQVSHICLAGDTVRTCDFWGGLTLTKAAADTMRLLEYIECIGSYYADGGISGISSEKCGSLLFGRMPREIDPFGLLCAACDR